MGVAAFSGEKEKITLIFLKKFLYILVVGNIEVLPVIKPRAFKLFIIYFKAHGAHKVEPCSRCGAGSRNVTRILRDLGLDHNDVYLHIYHLRVIRFTVIII